MEIFFIPNGAAALKEGVAGKGSDGSDDAPAWPAGLFSKPVLAFRFDTAGKHAGTLYPDGTWVACAGGSEGSSPPESDGDGVAEI